MKFVQIGTTESTETVNLMRYHVSYKETIKLQNSSLHLPDLFLTT